MAHSVPPVIRAVIIQNKSAVVAQVPTPILLDDEVLVKVKTVALNPTDWKHVKSGWGPDGSICGCDLTGEIVQVGPKLIAPLSIGDRVTGLVYGGVDSDRGAFAEYAKVYSGHVWKIPENTSYEEAATYGVPCVTPVQAMFHPDRLGLVEPPNKAEGHPWIFIYGGSTAVGHFAIQWAKLAGYRVATTASPRNFDLVKSLGPDVVFDYNDTELVTKVKQATGDSLHNAFDAFSQSQSQVISVSVLAPGKGHVVVLLPVSKDAKALREDVTIQDTYLYSIGGREWGIAGMSFPPSESDRAQVTELFKHKLSLYVKERKLKPMKVKSWPGGLDATQDAMNYMAEGKVSAEKIVITVSE